MATCSILDEIYIDADKFFDALEKAEEYARTHAQIVPENILGTREDMRRRFGKKDEEM